MYVIPHTRTQFCASTGLRRLAMAIHYILRNINDCSTRAGCIELLNTCQLVESEERGTRQPGKPTILSRPLALQTVSRLLCLSLAVR